MDWCQDFFFHRMSNIHRETFVPEAGFTEIGQRDEDGFLPYVSVGVYVCEKDREQLCIGVFVQNCVCLSCMWWLFTIHMYFLYGRFFPSTLP